MSKDRTEQKETEKNRQTETDTKIDGAVFNLAKTNPSRIDVVLRQNSTLKNQITRLYVYILNNYIN